MPNFIMICIQSKQVFDTWGRRYVWIDLTIMRIIICMLSSMFNTLFYFFDNLQWYQEKKGNTRGKSSSQTDSMTCGRLPLLKKKNSLDWTTYLAATWAAELQHLRTQQKEKTKTIWWNFLSLSLSINLALLNEGTRGSHMIILLAT